jgi:cation diffusion facilitator CzcD-associated flavoprotein CzcO
VRVGEVDGDSGVDLELRSIDEQANDTAAEFIRGKIAAGLDSPEMARLLTPIGYPFGAKRPPVDAGFYETFNRPDVTLVDIRTDPVRSFTRTGPARRRGSTTWTSWWSRPASTR